MKSKMMFVAAFWQLESLKLILMLLKKQSCKITATAKFSTEKMANIKQTLTRK